LPEVGQRLLGKLVKTTLVRIAFDLAIELGRVEFFEPSPKPDKILR
jgi:hypothetical protein